MMPGTNIIIKITNRGMANGIPNPNGIKNSIIIIDAIAISIVEII